MHFIDRRMKYVRFALCLVTAVFAYLAFASMIISKAQAGSAGLQEASDPMAAPDVLRGEKLFSSNCAFCHGPTAKGSSAGVSLIDSSLVRHDKAGDLIAPVVREGRASKGMPSFAGLDATQVSDLAAYLHARIAITDSVETAGPRGGYALQHLLTGDAAAGKNFFNGAGGCNKCHSASGDLAGIAKKYQPAELEARFLYPRDSAATATVTLPSGDKIKGKVAYEDAFYIAIIDNAGRYRSWPLSGLKIVIDDPLQAHVALLDRYTNKDVHDIFAYLETLQ